MKSTIISWDGSFVTCFYKDGLSFCIPLPCMAWQYAAWRDSLHPRSCQSKRMSVDTVAGYQHSRFLDPLGKILLGWTAVSFLCWQSSENLVQKMLIMIMSGVLWRFLWYFLIGPRQANLLLIAYASSEGSGEPVHPRSLARTSAARSYKQWVKRNLRKESQIPGPSEWLGMRS